MMRVEVRRLTVAQIKRLLCPYFGLKALNQDGDEQVEEDVVAEGHEGHKVEGGQRRGGGHPVVEHRVPVLLGEDLQTGVRRDAGIRKMKKKKKSGSGFFI
ncbi:hypothetical protein EYF80_029506 [Liparis tanakae]|uniref:Uncharacterized protein n=1 Tax=Liparis tanakae TaxID=230148 RepID=A0A4Z2H598_9TELE|nr:hypothetical protein EYF80_029506 [Liparis tanakae]